MTRQRRYVLYGRYSCPYCVEASDLLGSLGLDCQFIDIEKDPEFLQELKEFYQHKTVPMIIRIDEAGVVKFIGGYDNLKEEVND